VRRVPNVNLGLTYYLENYYSFNQNAEIKNKITGRHEQLLVSNIKMFPLGGMQRVQGLLMKISDPLLSLKLLQLES